jgi:hypothetical protein
MKNAFYKYTPDHLKNTLQVTRWVKLNDLNFDIIYWSVKDKFIDILN